MARQKGAWSVSLRKIWMVQKRSLSDAKSYQRLLYSDSGKTLFPGLGNRVPRGQVKHIYFYSRNKKGTMESLNLQSEKSRLVRQEALRKTVGWSCDI